MSADFFYESELLKFSGHHVDRTVILNDDMLLAVHHLKMSIPSRFFSDRRIFLIYSHLW